MNGSRLLYKVSRVVPQAIVGLLQGNFFKSPQILGLIPLLQNRKFIIIVPVRKSANFLN
jgi:hypothetical protein